MKKKLTFIIIENEKPRHETLWFALRDIFPDKSVAIAPDHTSPCVDWDTARQVIEGISRDNELIVFADLNLNGSDPNDARTGALECRRLRLLRPDAQFIAATSFSSVLEEVPDAKQVFALILNKYDSVWRPEHERELISYLRDKIAFVRGRKGETLELKIVNSQQLHLAEAALTREGLRHLVEEQTTGWSDRVVRALSGGLSGSHLLEISGHKDGLQIALLIKAAAHRESLQAEIQNLKDFRHQLDQFTVHVNIPEDNPQPLPGQRGYFYIQPRVPGENLLELLKDPARIQEEQAATKELIGLLVAQYNNAITQSHPHSSDSLAEKFAFRPNHIQRLRDSVASLLPMARILAAARQWPLNVPAPEVLFAAFDTLVNDWSKHVSTIIVPFWAVQHGDLHPGNVLAQNGRLGFVDFSHLGRWPIGYDLSRFASFARFQIPGHVDGSEWVLNQLTEWSREPFANFNTPTATSLVPAATACDVAFAAFARSLSTREADVLLRLYTFCTISDLLRAVTYTHRSPFKRLWMVIVCHQLSETLGWLKA